MEPSAAQQPAMPPEDFEAWARAEFLRKHPGQKPLNWAIARKAEEFRRTDPMGGFVLDENDCSDFTDAILDDALGAKARFRRGSKHHLLAADERLWEFHAYSPGVTLQPGDEIAVRHSPHYAPDESAPWHRGIIGTDGMAYDWTKLQSWGAPRYGRHTIEWFTQHSRGPNEVIVRRLAPKYRYRLEPVPLGGPQAAAPKRAAATP